MKNILGDKFKEYWGIVTYVVVLVYAIFNFSNLISGVKGIIGIISPFIVGIAIAFVLNLVMKIFEEKIFNFLSDKKYKKYLKFKRPLSVFLLSLLYF